MESTKSNATSCFSPNQNNMMMQQQTSINSNAHLGMQQGVVVQAAPLNHNRQNI